MEKWRNGRIGESLSLTPGGGSLEPKAVRRPGARYFLEAGSGASSPVPPEMITSSRKCAPNALIIVGGGMHSGELALQSVRAGADWIVTGNLTEE